jgi:hypothetical protein
MHMLPSTLSGMQCQRCIVRCILGFAICIQSRNAQLALQTVFFHQRDEGSDRHDGRTCRWQTCIPCLVDLYVVHTSSPAKAVEVPLLLCTG